MDPEDEGAQGAGRRDAEVLDPVRVGEEPARGGDGEAQDVEGLEEEEAPAVAPLDVPCEERVDCRAEEPWEEAGEGEEGHDVRVGSWLKLS